MQIFSLVIFWMCVHGYCKYFDFHSSLHDLGTQGSLWKSSPLFPYLCSDDDFLDVCSRITRPCAFCKDFDLVHTHFSADLVPSFAFVSPFLR